MRSPNEIFEDAKRLITMEALATTTPQGEMGLSEFDRVAARSGLLPLLQEAAELQNIDLLLRIEYAFLEIGLVHLVHTRESMASFNKAVRQMRAAIAMLDHVRVPDEYRWTRVHFTQPENLVNGLPKDEAHGFFASHGARLGNTLKMPPEEDKAALINARISNIKLARDIYMDLQRHALATSEIGEPAKPYKPERKLQKAA